MAPGLTPRPPLPPVGGEAEGLLPDVEGLTDAVPRILQIRMEGFGIHLLSYDVNSTPNHLKLPAD